MAKIRRVLKGENIWQYHFICPGCNHKHIFDNRWQFNQDLDKPTISPSFLQKGFLGYKNEKPLYGTCHLFIKNGKIQFLNDCTHDLKGQIVELPEQANRYN